MRYKVSGAHRANGARMTLEFEAESKGAAERRAAQAGMTVHHVAEIPGLDDPEPTLGSGGRRTGMHPILKLILLGALAVVVWFYVIPLVRGRG